MERKVKYDYAFKLECVELVLKKHYSCELVSKQKGPNKSNINKWVKFYKQYGRTGLLPKKNQNYSPDFKLKACLKFNITSESVIIKWQKDFTTFGIAGLQSKPKGRPKSMSDYKRKKRKTDKPLTREEELLLENESLRCELEYLKKLQALIQAEEKAKRLKS